jgi:hypothetical protein
MNKIETKMLEFNVNWQSIKRGCMRTIGKYDSYQKTLKR